MHPSAFKVSGPQAQGMRGPGSKLHQNVKGWDVRAKCYQNPCRGLDFTSPPHTYIYSDKQLYAHINIDR